MKRILVLLACLAIGVFSASIAFGFTGTFTPGEGINNSPHNMYNQAGGVPAGYNNDAADDLNRICIFCHAPHHTWKTFGTTDGTGQEAPNATYTYLPLWNHQLTTDYLGSWVPYTNGSEQPISGPKMSQGIANYTNIGSTSLLCLSCHDGTVAVNEYGWSQTNSHSRGSGGAKMGDSPAQEYVIGKDGYLGNHHPVGFTWDSQLSVDDPEIYDIATAVFTHNDGTTKEIQNLLWNNKMECGTCHAVHNTGNTGEMLLYMSDRNSNLCLSCHKKGSLTTETYAIGAAR